jgi:AmmeMemoRadiSam system protein B/AmmeMemoRadiSam system protein A
MPVKAHAAVVGVLMLSTSVLADVRQPAVAGSFYPGERGELARQVAALLPPAPVGAVAPVAVIVPHAGYVYSGATAGKTFAALKGASASRVILLGPSHHAGFKGGALPPARTKAFLTPLGELPIDRDALAALRRDPFFKGPEEAHAPEHCLEVELPFVQATLGAVPIVPILVGHATDDDTAAAMARALAPFVTAGTIVIVSTDFTHHGQSYGHAPFARDKALDATLLGLGRATAERAAAVDPRGFIAQVETSGDTVCGARPVQVLLELLSHSFTGAGTVVDVTTSAAVSGSLSQVVTYAGVAFTGTWTAWRESERPPALEALDKTEQAAALSLARATLDTYLNHGPALARWFAAHPVSGNLLAPAGVFVTLHNTGEREKRLGRLRGCIGVMEARERLVDAILHNAISAAHDPRFSALEAKELPALDLEISVLSPLKPVPSADLIALGTHGVVLSKGGRRAVFLPQVATETGWDLPTFLSNLAAKAGLSSDAWRTGARFEVFTAQVFGETAP